MNYTGKLDDGRTFALAIAAASVVLTIAGVQVYPEPPVVIPPVVDNATVIFKGGTLSADKLVYTQGDYQIKAAGQYTGGLNFAYNTRIIGPGTYKDKIIIKRVDGAAFPLASLSLIGDGTNTYGIAGANGYTMTPNGSIPDFKPKTDDGGKSYYFTSGGGAPGIVSMQIGSGTQVVIPPVVPPPVTTGRMNGGISDGSTAEVHAPFFKDVGFNSIRIWVSFDPKTGDVNGGDQKIDSINHYFSLGLIPRIVLTPNTDLTTAPGIPQAAINRIIARLDKRVQINLINEPNLDQYWPGGQSKQAWFAAFQWADAVAGQLKAAGFVCGSPSFTGWVESWEAWYLQLAAANLLKNFGYLCFHTYPNSNANVDKFGWINLFESMNALARKIATKYGKKVDIDEWGFGKSVNDDIVVELMPRVQASLNKDTDSSAYFIVGRSGSDAAPKLPHDLFSWLIDFKINQRREKIIAAFKGVK